MTAPSSLVLLKIPAYGIVHWDVEIKGVMSDEFSMNFHDVSQVRGGIATNASALAYYWGHVNGNQSAGLKSVFSHVTLNSIFLSVRVTSSVVRANCRS